MIPALAEAYGFDPTYGYGVEELQAVQAPKAPRSFAAFWQQVYAKSLHAVPRPVLSDTGTASRGWRVFDWKHTSTGGFQIGGWLLLPSTGAPRRGFVVTHGYGGRDAPDPDLPFADAAILFPCLRGLGRSARAPYSADPWWHVLHDIDKPRRYVLRGCAEDVWTSVSGLLRVFPYLEGHLGYLGESFGGGIGALATPWDDRIQRVHLSLPTFGHHPLRMRFPSVGSGESLRRYARGQVPQVLQTLGFYDAAVAARFFRKPVHCAVARVDPAVPAPGQYAVANAIESAREIFEFSGGHFEYEGMKEERARLHAELERFFADL